MAKKKAVGNKVKETQEKTPSGGFPPSVGTGRRRAPISPESPHTGKPVRQAQGKA
jgi:hypothetical protein